MTARGLKAGDRVRVKWPGYWANGKIVEVAEGSREWGLPIIHAEIPGPVVIDPDRVVFIGRAVDV